METYNIKANIIKATYQIITNTDINYIKMNNEIILNNFLNVSPFDWESSLKMIDFMIENSLIDDKDIRRN